MVCAGAWRLIPTNGSYALNLLPKKLSAMLRVARHRVRMAEVDHAARQADPVPDDWVATARADAARFDGEGIIKVRQAEARDVAPEYAPETVGADGWAATRNAFQALFPLITVVLCFLHGFLKIRDRCRKAHELHRRVWDVYRAATAEEFRGRMNELQQWWATQTWTAPVAPPRRRAARASNRSPNSSQRATMSPG